MVHGSLVGGVGPAVVHPELPAECCTLSRLRSGLSQRRAAAAAGLPHLRQALPPRLPLQVVPQLRQERVPALPVALVTQCATGTWLEAAPWSRSVEG